MPTVANQKRGGLDGDLDARLLSDKSEEDSGNESKSGDLRAAKRASSKSEPGYLSDEPQSLRQAVLRAKIEKRIREEKKSKSNVIKKISGFRKATSALLRSAWINLITFFGLTTIWIDIHVFLNKVLGDKFFCKLGEEWTDAGGANISETEAGRVVKNTVGKAEEVGCGCLNFGCLAVILAVFVLIALITDLIESPLAFFVEYIGFTWDGLKQMIVEN